MLRLGIVEVKERLDHRARLAAAGVDVAGDVSLGTLVLLWRRFRSGTEMIEVLPLWLAELTLAAIPENEPDVERAALRWRRHDHDLA